MHRSSNTNRMWQYYFYSLALRSRKIRDPAIRSANADLLPWVTSGFTPEGLYNAAVLMVFAHDTLWQKLCFEQDDHGHHRVVSVRTDGTSDDCNHDPHDDVSSIYLKISSNTHTVGCYYSLNGKDWVMVRVSKNCFPQQLFVGIASQCPRKGECCSTFAELSLDTDNISDFRTGS